jgi:hypothetical protein
MKRSFRIVFVSWMLLFGACACGDEARSLGKTTLDGVSLELGESADAKLNVTVQASAPYSIALETKAWPEGKGIRPDQPFSAKMFSLSDGASGAWLNFGLDDGSGGVRCVAVLLARPDPTARWVLVRDWAADSVALGEMGYKREKQAFTTEAGRIERTFHSLGVEGIAHKLDCGCTACQSRCTEIEESEALMWNGSSRKFALQKHEKWYIAQPGENLMTAVRKALGEARLACREVEYGAAGRDVIQRRRKNSRAAREQQ